MNSNKKAKNIIEKIQEHSGRQLEAADELEAIISSAIAKDQVNILKDCAFTSKYLLGLERIMQSNISFSNLSTNGTNKIDISHEDKVTEDAMERIKREYKDHFTKLTTCLENIINNMSEDKEMFRLKYLSLNQSSLNHIRDLIKDMSVFKQFLNEYPASI